MRKTKKLLSILLAFVFSVLLISCGESNQVNNSTKAETQKQAEAEQSKVTKKSGWAQENGKWYYYDTNAKPKTGWIKDNGKDYYFDNSGVMQTGWKQINSKWYYLNKDGSMAANTTVDGYTLASNGARQEKSSSSSSKPTGGSLTSNNDSTTTNEPAQGNRTVYWVSNGKSYHYDKNCKTLARSNNIQQGPASSCPKTDPCDVCVK